MGTGVRNSRGWPYQGLKWEIPAKAVGEGVILLTFTNMALADHTQGPLKVAAIQAKV